MQPINQFDVREAEIAKIAESKEDVAALQQHLKEVIEGTAFKGSHRSGQFLKYIVDQAIAGHFESMKERVIGVELFGRSPSYDTGEDAIVRVTASDVRRRLMQHYGKYGTTSDFRLSLPLGSYIPEITRTFRAETSPLDALRVHEELAGSTHHDSTVAHQDSAVVQVESVVISTAVPHLTAPVRNENSSRWLTLIILLVTLNLVLWGIFWMRHSPTQAVPVSVLPWSAFARSSRSIQIITSDPSVAEIQDLTGGQISVSDYANHNYIPNPGALTPEINRICHAFLAGDKVSAIDTRIAVEIATLAKAYSETIGVHAARDTKFADLKTDDNFIFLGSPRSNPWSSLFSDQLDFRFVFDNGSRQEIVRNFHPHADELPAYIPTAMGGGTGQSFALIALVQNIDQNGHVLLLAGANAEGTEAAGRLATDPPRLSSALQKCGIPPSRQQHFELLLRLTTMAGSPNGVDVLACHILPGPSAQKP
jgi:hypothetical protein